MKKILRNIDKKLLILSVILFIAGLIMVYSASNVTAYMRYDASSSRFFIKQLMFLVTGFFGCLFLIRYPTKTYPVFSWIFLICITIILLMLLIYGTATNNAISWIGYKGYGIQPSEFAKVIIIPWLATYYELNQNNLNNTKKMIIPLIVIALITILIVLQNDFGTAFIFFCLSMFLFFISPTSKKIKKTIFLMGVSAIGMGLLLIVVTNGKILPSSKLERFNFSNPCDRFLTSGNQVCNGYIAINNGGIFGKGLGNSIQKYLYLPEAYTDFIFAIIVEELGLLGGASIIILYTLVLGRIIIAARRTPKNSNAMICYGVAMFIFLHIFVNLGGVLGLIPLTGVPLTFMSYGGSFTWAIIISLTFVQRINYETNLQLKQG